MLGSDPSGGGFGADFFTFLVAGVLDVVEEDFVEVESTTVRPILNNGKFKFPETFPLNSSERPEFGKENKTFSWAQCSQCCKFRCVPKSLHDALKTWNMQFSCKFEVTDEGRARGCDEPEDVSKKSSEKGKKGKKKVSVCGVSSDSYGTY